MGTSSKYPRLDTSRLRKAVKAGRGGEIPGSGEPSPKRVADAVLLEMLDPDLVPDDPVEPLTILGGAAADRFATVMSEILADRRPLPETPRLLEEFVDDVTGSGDSIADSIVRRAATTTARRLVEEATDRQSRGAELGDDLFCLLYRHFHADMLAEFVLSSVAEAALPGIATLLSNTEIGKWAIERVLKLLPDPCRVSEEENAGSPIAIAHRLAERGMERLLSPGTEGVEGT